MVNLSDLAGIDLAWAEDGTLALGDDLLVDETRPRERGRLRPVALDPDSCEPAKQIQFWMYNGVRRRKDHALLANTGLRYELTLMYPHSLGHERAKTIGHLHNTPTNSHLNYTEICEVLYGTAYFLFQTLNVATRSAPFVAMVEAHPGDKVVIPPNMYHVAINAGDEPLLFSDIVPLAVQGIYEPLAQMHGAAYLSTVDQGWIKNPTYSSVADLQRWSPEPFPDLGLTTDRSLYQTFVETAEATRWMLAPSQFSTTFPKIWTAIAAALAI
ncbi:MAG: glucose-6-phosphate isomerase family protein [Chloroflexota bacterium]